MLKLTSIAMTGLLALAAAAPAQAANLVSNTAVTGSTIVVDNVIEAPVSSDVLQGKAENRRHFRSRGFGHSRGLHHGKSRLKQKKIFGHHKGLNRSFSRHHNRGLGHHKKFSKFGVSKFHGHRNFRRR